MKLEYDYELKSSKQLMKFLDAWLKKNMGKRCKSRAAGCVKCRMYAMRDLIEVELI